MASARNRGHTNRLATRLFIMSVSTLFLLAGQPIAQAQVDYSMEKVYYGYGWRLDPATGIRRQLVLLNLTEGYEESYPSGGLFSTFTQLFIEFSLPMNASGPEDGPGLLIRLSYHVAAICFQLSETTCPLGANLSATSQDVFELELRRILEYRDEDGSGSYDPGEPTVREVSLSQPEFPFAAISASGVNGSDIALPYDRNISWEAGNITQGALFAGDPLLDELFNFRIAVGIGSPLNLTLDSFLFLQPTAYKGIPLTPSQLKLDINLGGISYIESDTSLALELMLRSTQHRFLANATGSSETVYTSSAAAEAFFTWSVNATVDGQTGRVGSTLLATNDSAITLYLAYPRGELITHDPVLGLSPPSSGTPADATSPAVSISFPSPGASLATSNVMVSWSASDEDSGLAYVEDMLDDDAPVWLSSTASSYIFSDVEDDSHTVTVAAFDLAGNSQVASVDFVVDTAPPTVSMSSPSEDAIVTSSSVEVAWAATDEISGIDHFEVSLDDGTPVVLSGTASGHTLSDVSDGSHTVTVTAFDRAGNSFTVSVDFTVDTGIFSPTGPYGSGPLISVVVGVVAAAALIVVVMLRRRRGTPPKNVS